MLIIKKRNIQKGFSLIELMVAAAILAIAILGIYQAYNVSFMGMADARDRTVAANYVREAMEGIKNMDFDKIITQSRSYITGSKYKYEREVIVQESTNLKKVTTKVYWKNKNGNTKIVENGMLVHFMQTSEGTATRIMLIANPYNVLTGGTSTITAVIKDAKGNTVTAWNGGDISFSIDAANSTSSGTFSNKSGIIKGKVTIDFTAENTEGTVTIVASANGLSSDSIEMKVTEPKKPVKINLTANPTYMAAGTGSTSVITATIVDAGGETVTEITNVITFSVSGPGTLSAITYTAHTIGIAKITLTSNGTPGTITVTVSATDLEPGVVNVITGGKISLSAPRFSVPVNETSKVTVTTKDVNGVSINYIGYINLEISPNPDGAGIFENDLNTIEVYFNGSTSSNTITFTGTSVGIVNINAEDQAGILTSADPLSLTITPALAPDHIELTASPQIVPQGNTSTITATVYNARGKIVLNYTGIITFKTTLGTFSNDSTTMDVEVDSGKAITVLTSDSPGNAIIEITYPAPTELPFTPLGGLVVGFYGGADHIKLTANPKYVKVDGVSTSTITATICDSNDIHVSNYTGIITFETTLGTLSGDPPSVSTVNGVANIDISHNSPGTVTVTANDADSLLEEGSVEVIFYQETTLTLVENSAKYSPTGLIVTFKVNLIGENILLDEMKVSWTGSSAPQRLNKIVINSEQVYTGNDKSDTIVDIIDKTLLAGESIIELTFGRNMAGKIITVIFYPYIGSYTVELFK